MSQSRCPSTSRNDSGRFLGNEPIQLCVAFQHQDYYGSAVRSSAYVNCGRNQAWFIKTESALTAAQLSLGVVAALCLRTSQ